MIIIYITVFTYFILASTLGAYYLATIDPENKGHDITLFDVVGNILPSIVLIVPLLIITLLSKIVIKKSDN